MRQRKHLSHEQESTLTGLSLQENPGGSVFFKWHWKCTVIASREVTYLAVGKGKSSSNIPWVGICQFPGG